MDSIVILQSSESQLNSTFGEFPEGHSKNREINFVLSGYFQVRDCGNLVCLWLWQYCATVGYTRDWLRKCHFLVLRKVHRKLKKIEENWRYLRTIEKWFLKETCYYMWWKGKKDWKCINEYYCSLICFTHRAFFHVRHLTSVKRTMHYAVWYILSFSILSKFLCILHSLIKLFSFFSKLFNSIWFDSWNSYDNYKYKFLFLYFVFTIYISCITNLFIRILGLLIIWQHYVHWIKLFSYHQARLLRHRFFFMFHLS